MPGTGYWAASRARGLPEGRDTQVLFASRAFVKVSRMRRLRFSAALLAALALVLALAPAALASDGVGIAGRVSDKTVTLVMFGVIAFFPALVIVLALIQGRLEARKDRRRYDLERLN